MTQTSRSISQAQYVRVFGSNLDDDLEVLTNIDAKHLLHTGHILFSCESTKVIDEPLQPENQLKILNLTYE